MTAATADAAAPRLPLDGLPAEAILDRIPPVLRPFAAAYVPVLLAMTQAELTAWIQYAVYGHADQAWSALVAGLGQDTVADAWSRINARWAAANTRNAGDVETGRQAIAALVNILLAALLAAIAG